MIFVLKIPIGSSLFKISKFVLRFEDSTQPAKRIKQEPTDPDIKESKVFVDAITQTEAFDADLKVEITTQTDRPLIFVCKLYMCGHNRF